MKADTGYLRRIAGRHNPLVKQLRYGFHQGELTATGDCAIEGFRIVEEAIRSGLKLKALFLSESGQTRAARLLPQIGSRVETVLLPEELFTSVVPSQSPQGVAALVELKSFELEEVLLRPAPDPLLVIAGVQDPGNLGTMVRSAEAFGAKGVLLGEGTVSAFNHKVIRASAGSAFRMPMVKIELSATLPLLRARGIRLLATSSHKGKALYHSDLRGQSAILVGNEGGGVSKRLLAEMDQLVLIPHASRVESLNAAIAASITLYEVMRQKLSTHESRRGLEHSALAEEAG
jgi:RNA methyltransferase, TrmH family